MTMHPRAKLGLAARRELVSTIERRGSIRAGARTFNVSPATAKKWWDRWQRADEAERRSLACLHDRSSRPHRSPNELPRAEQERICEVRRHTGWGPRLIAGSVGRPHSTVHRTLQRHGYSRQPKPRREPANRYEWPCPGDLLHLDSKSYARFERPGHAVTGDRRTKGARLTRRKLGYDFAHAAVDDHSRLAFCELLPDERAASITGFVEHALGFYEARGIRIKRILTDNHWSYTKNRSLRALLKRHGIEHRTIRPYRARTNGKVERFHQTMAREWGYGLAYSSSEQRRRALPHWLRYYNEQRPHSSIGDRPPISRVYDVSGQDT
jgi:transposase InsO family protein